MKNSTGWAVTGILGVMIFLIALYIFVVSYPFYSWDSHFKVAAGIYRPGDCVEISTDRKSQINVSAIAVRELVRVNGKGHEYEIEKIKYPINFDKGDKNITVYFRLPKNELLVSGQYKYTGTAVYVPWNFVKRKISFETELFEVVAE